MAIGKVTTIAFDELEHVLIGKQRHNLGSLVELPNKSPLFVTWTKKGSLRGCIGTFSPQPTIEGIRKYALIAALEDPRFKPIAAKELPDLEVAVTLLGPLEPIDDPFDWNIGLHGVKAIFAGQHSSTFLPEVPEEQGWSKAETIEELAQKAGVSSTKGLKMYRYEGKKEKMSYTEYQRSMASK